MICEKTSIGPSVLLENEQKWNESHWFAVYTKSRHEKLLEQELRKKQIQTFLPLRTVTRFWSDRKKNIEEPIFKSYLFVRIPWKERWSVLNSVGAVNFVGPHLSYPVEVSENEIISIQKFIQEKVSLDPFPYLKQGQRVYVRSGPFKGVEGFVVRKDSHCRLVISLDLLMQSISVAIDEACVEPL